jgi:hypothetical protein
VGVVAMDRGEGFEAGVETDTACLSDESDKLLLGAYSLIGTGVDGGFCSEEQATSRPISDNRLKVKDDEGLEGATYGYGIELCMESTQEKK